VHATSTVHVAEAEVPTPVPPASDRKTFSKAITDIREGLAARELWTHLGWQDIKQRYRRSVIGPFWITISQGVIALGLGLLYSQLFNTPIQVFLPYLSTGFIIWGFIQGCLSEGMETFIANEGMIKQLPAPLSVYVLRTVWRQILLLAHNLIVYVVLMIIFFSALDKPYSLGSKEGFPPGACAPGLFCHPGLSWNILLAIPGFILLALTACWAALLLGIISTRFRDIPQVINSLIQLMFYGTPIVWPVDQLMTGGSRQKLDWILPVIKANPLYHYMQVTRAPLIGQAVSWTSWAIVGGLTIVGWALALVAMRNYRSRVSYWV
jgi:ABC-2 type transport system permease protein